MEKQRKKFGIMFRLKTYEPEKYEKLKNDYHNKSIGHLRIAYPEFFPNGRKTLPGSFYSEFGKRNYVNPWGSTYTKVHASDLKVIRKYGPEGMLTPGSKFGPKASTEPKNYYDDPEFEKVPFYKPMKNPT